MAASQEESQGTDVTGNIHQIEVNGNIRYTRSIDHLPGNIAKEDYRILMGCLETRRHDHSLLLP
jgi:hypothetical protein